MWEGLKHTLDTGIEKKKPSWYQCQDIAYSASHIPESILISDDEQHPFMWQPMPRYGNKVTMQQASISADVHV